MSKLILLMGIPGSGKSTLAELLRRKGYSCLSADSIRKELWGDESEQKDPDKVFGLFFKRLDQLLSKKNNIVIDNTNINLKHRQPIIERARQAEYTEIQLWWLDTPLEVCLERNQNRLRKVPEDIVRNMHKTITGYGKPQNTEGKILIVRPNKEALKYHFYETIAKDDTTLKESKESFVSEIFEIF